MTGLLAAAVAALLAVASPGLDTVFLRDGGRLRGTVIEESPGAGVVVQLPDGRTERVTADRVSRVLYAGEAAVPEPAPPDPTARRHTGFLLRLELGPSYLHASANADGAKVVLAGNGSVFALSLGGAVSETFAVGGQIWGAGVTRPHVTVEGPTTFSGSGEGSVTLSGYGLLLNWYAQPANVYLAVVPSLTQLEVDDGLYPSRSDWGVGLRLAVGKEWWVSNHWALGLDFSLGMSTNHDPNLDVHPTWGSSAWALSFSATYN